MTRFLPPRDQRPLLLFMPPAIVALITICIILLAVVWPDPLKLSNTMYVPEDATICPGEILTFTWDLRVRYPLGALLITSWWDPDNQRQIDGQGPSQWMAWGIETHDTRTITATVPDLGPGNRELLGSIMQFQGGNEPVFFKVPFQIPGDCP